MATDMQVIWVRRESEYFWERDWTTQIRLNAKENFPSPRKEFFFVIPGHAKREPGIHSPRVSFSTKRHDRDYGFRACAKWRIPE
jgi:hypothetical protein